jgi:hypothetical protein
MRIGSDLVESYGEAGLIAADLEMGVGHVGGDGHPGSGVLGLGGFVLVLGVGRSARSLWPTRAAEFTCSYGERHRRTLLLASETSDLMCGLSG